jgi:hypothetical protein
MAEIEKIAVYDPRIIQEKPRYAVQQGALSVSTSQFYASSASTSQLSFQVLVPSLNVFVDRKVELNTSCTVYSEAVSPQSLTAGVGSSATSPPIQIAQPAGASTVVGVTGTTTVSAVASAVPTPYLTYLQSPVQKPVPLTFQGTTSGPINTANNTAVVLPDNLFGTQGLTPAPTIATYGGGLFTYHPIGAPYDLSPSMFPVQSLCTSMTVTVNDCSVSLVGDTLKEQLLLAQTRESIHQRTCPSKFDMYAWTADDAIADNGVTFGYGGARDSDIPNGAWPIRFLDPANGRLLQRFDSYTYTSSTGTVNVPVINYRPAFIPQNSALVSRIIPGQPGTSYKNSGGGTDMTIVPSDATQAIPVMYRLQTVEPLVISPFLWQDSKQMSEVGLYGITNMTVTMNLQDPGATIGYNKGPLPVLQASGAQQNLVVYSDKLDNSLNSFGAMTRGAGIHALFSRTKIQPAANNSSSQSGGWETPRLFVTFLTPPPNTPLPPVSCVPYVEFPRYISGATASFASPGIVTVNSNTVTLSSIPDILVVFVKSKYRGQTQGDTYIPIRSVAVTFDNYSNLCSNYTQEDLYACSVAAGLDMDFSQFRGYARSLKGTATPVVSVGGTSGVFDSKVEPSPYVQLTGSPVLLRMGQDIPLSSGLAPGVLGNYSVQVRLDLDNTNGFFGYIDGIAQTNNVNVYIMGVNSGFFESCKGTSAIRKTILNTIDVENASASSSVTATQLQRLVGGTGLRTSSRMTADMSVPQADFAPASSESSSRKRPYSGSMIMS